MYIYPLDSSYNGKTLIISEIQNQNPKIKTESSSGSITTYYDLAAGTNKLFFDFVRINSTDSRDFEYESVKFVWVWNTVSDSGNWYPFR